MQFIIPQVPVKAVVGIGDPLLIPRDIKCINTGIHHRGSFNGLLIKLCLIPAPGKPAIITNGGEIIS